MESCTCHSHGTGGVILLDFNEDELYAALETEHRGEVRVEFRGTEHTFSKPSVSEEIRRRFGNRIKRK